MTRPLVALIVPVALLTLAACSTEEEMRAVDPADSASDVEPAVSPDDLPTALPAATGPVTTDGLVTVLDDGGGPELCTFVAESLPPQCSGTPLTDWDWAAHPEHEDQSGTKWGSFAVTGTFDGATLAATDAIPAALYDAMNVPPDDEFATQCAPPDGGWGVVDQATTNQESMDATFAEAAQLPGYAGSWIDPSPDDAEPTAAPVEKSGGAEVDDPTKLVINVAVTEDLAGAEATLRETWGGALCVSEAAYTEAELNEVALELQKLPGVTSSSAADDVVNIGVVFDDGSLQAWADEAYGEGRVAITSTLLPVG